VLDVDVFHSHPPCWSQGTFKTLKVKQNILCIKRHNMDCGRGTNGEALNSISGLAKKKAELVVHTCNSSTPKAGAGY
jgi:hypothetical protein